MISEIGHRLNIYGPSTCPICGNRRETVFYGRHLSCRRHPGHPLFDGAETTTEGVGGPRDVMADIAVSAPVGR